MGGVDLKGKGVPSVMIGYGSQCLIMLSDLCYSLILKRLQRPLKSMLWSLMLVDLIDLRLL